MDRAVRFVLNAALALYVISNKDLRACRESGTGVWGYGGIMR